MRAKNQPYIPFVHMNNHIIVSNFASDWFAHDAIASCQAGRNGPSSIEGPPSREAPFLTRIQSSFEIEEEIIHRVMEIELENNRETRVRVLLEIIQHCLLAFLLMTLGAAFASN